MTDIRHDFGDDGWKWYRGALAPTSIIYCPPGNSSHHGMILNIDMNTNMATELDVNLLPAEQGVGWESCAAALDGCIYFMHQNAR